MCHLKGTGANSFIIVANFTEAKFGNNFLTRACFQHFGVCDMNTYETIDCIDFSTKKKVKEESYCEVKDLSKIQLRIGCNM